MHELSLCQQVARVVQGAADGRAVEVVHLQVGRLRQVVPQTLVYCWSLVVEDGPLAGSRLEVDSVPVTLSCRACAACTAVAHELVLVCAACGSGDVEVRTGEEFLVTSLDVSTTSPSVTFRTPSEEH